MIEDTKAKKVTRWLVILIPLFSIIGLLIFGSCTGKLDGEFIVTTLLILSIPAIALICIWAWNIE